MLRGQTSPPPTLRGVSLPSLSESQPHSLADQPLWNVIDYVVFMPPVTFHRLRGRGVTRAANPLPFVQ